MTALPSPCPHCLTPTHATEADGYGRCLLCVLALEGEALVPCFAGCGRSVGLHRLPAGEEHAFCAVCEHGLRVAGLPLELEP